MDSLIQLHSERDTKTGWETGHLPASSKEAEYNCCGRKTYNQKVGCRDDNGFAQVFACGGPAHPAMSRRSTNNRGKYLLNRHSKPKNVTLNLDFAKSITNTKCFFGNMKKEGYTAPSPMYRQ